ARGRGSPRRCRGPLPRAGQELLPTPGAAGRERAATRTRVPRARRGRALRRARSEMRSRLAAGEQLVETASIDPDGAELVAKHLVRLVGPELLGVVRLVEPVPDGREDHDVGRRDVACETRVLTVRDAGIHLDVVRGRSEL